MANETRERRIALYKDIIQRWQSSLVPEMSTLTKEHLLGIMGQTNEAFAEALAALTPEPPLCVCGACFNEIAEAVSEMKHATPAPVPPPAETGQRLGQVLISMRRIESANLDAIDAVYDYLRGWIREIEAIAASPAAPADASEYQELRERLGAACAAVEKGEIGPYGAIERIKAALADVEDVASPAAPDRTEPQVSIDVLNGVTVAGARAYWALKDLETRHEALRVAILSAVSTPELGYPNPTWTEIRAELAAAFNADSPAPERTAGPTPEGRETCEMWRPLPMKGICECGLRWHQHSEAVRATFAAGEGQPRP